MARGIIETELARQCEYEKIRTQVLTLKLQDINGRLLGFKENSNLMLRFLFNKIITSSPEDDPVFPTNRSILAEQQVEQDFKYHKITNCEPSTLSTLIDEGFTRTKKMLDTSIIPEDQTIHYDEKNNSLLYKGKTYSDIAGLAKRFPLYYAQAIALNIRYTYLRLLTHGLANNYSKMGYKSNDPIVEGFASSFNHYFDIYYSAFPDLEICFGSRGSFFNCEQFAEDMIMVNPPFDLSICIEAIRKIITCLDIASTQGKKQSFILTLPAWIDVVEFTSLETNKYIAKYEIIPKNKTNFIDHMQGLEIQPCSIIQITLNSIISSIQKIPTIPRRFRPVSIKIVPIIKYTVSIIGLSHITESSKTTIEVYGKMINDCFVQIKNNWNLNSTNVTLVSGGCSFSDHIAVLLYLTGKFKGLTLYLPCKFDGKFLDTGQFHWSQNPGRVLNKYHADFSREMGFDSLGDLTKAIEIGAKIEVKNGFHARNSFVAKSDYVIAFSEGEIIGGTLDTFNKAKDSIKSHLIILR